MAITLAERYTDATYSFGIIMPRKDSLDALGHSEELLHRENLTREDAIEFVESWIEEGGRAETFFIVATPKVAWEFAEIDRSLPAEAWS